MTDPVFPWLDPADVRGLAEALMCKSSDTSPTLVDAGFDEAFVGFGPVAAVPVLAPTLQPAREIQASAPVEPAPPVPQSAAAAASARGPFPDRIMRFRDWLRAQFGATGIFILDREGTVIFDESNHGRLHFLARSLALASRRQRNSTGNVHVKITAGSILEVIPVDTAYGCLVLGAVVPEALSQSAVGTVMEALAMVATPPGSIG